jgi:succinyl-CoA synthetase beta subunit
MKLYEFEGKSLLRSMGIPTPRGGMATRIEEAVDVAEAVGYPVVVKCQLLRGGRGKTGGIQFAENQQELCSSVAALFHHGLSGEKVDRLLIEEKIAIAKEYYAGITFDPHTSTPLLMVSTQGGVDIEEIAVQCPEKLAQMHLDPLKTYRLHHMVNLVLHTGLQGTDMLQLATLLLQLVLSYFKFQAITAEINPVIVDTQERLFAADAKFEIDDSGLFRVPEARAFERTDEALTDLELEAKQHGLSYVELSDGNIGLIAGGAGLGMASMDMIAAHGGKPANFLDLGGDATRAKSADALRIVLKTPGVDGVFINVFGGINNCEQIALGLADVIDHVKSEKTIVVKMRGHSQEEGWALLESRNIPFVKFGTTEEAVVLLKKKMHAKES